MLKGDGGNLRTIFLFGLFGALTYGIGGALSSYLHINLENPLVYSLQGALGGAVLGILAGDWRKAILLSLAGSVGFTLGFSLGSFVGLTWELPFPGQVLPYALGGLLGIGLLGVLYWDWQKIITLAVLGLLGFSGGYYLAANMQSTIGLGIRPGTREMPVILSEFEYRGINYPSWLEEEYAQPYAVVNLSKLADTGANHVVIVPTWYMTSLRDTKIRPSQAITLSDIPSDIRGQLEQGWESKSASDESVRKVIKEARTQGLQVILKPHVDPVVLEWRALINPVDTEAWFNSYRDFILYYAKMAESEGVEMLVIGTELRSMTLPRFRGQWETIISDIRSVYQGKLTYGANASNPAQEVWKDFWDGTSLPDEYATCSFFDLLDYIGIDCFFPLTGKENPSQEEILSAWQSNVNGYPLYGLIKSVSLKYQKPVIMTEIGYPDGNGANINPWEMPTRQYIPNYTEQANCYEAAFTFWNAHSEWMQGMLLWAWTAKPGGAYNFQHSPQNKPAEKVITKWYGGRHVVDQKGQSVKAMVQGALSGLAGGLISGLTFGLLLGRRRDWRR